jgi:hypothetical protein
MWQDAAIFLITLSFLFNLFPTIYSEGKPHWTTSFGTAFGLFLMGAIYITLDLYLSSIVAFLTAGLWTVIYIQTVRKGRDGETIEESLSKA